MLEIPDPDYLEDDPVLCGECSTPTVLVSGKKIYPHRPDLYSKSFYLCEKCGAYCGCHPNSTQSLGRPANQKTRTARQSAHRAFDRLWREGFMSRDHAYFLLTGAMGLCSGDCHIGQFTAQQADQAARWARDKYRELVKKQCGLT